MHFRLRTEIYFDGKNHLPDGAIIKNICILLHGLGANGKDLMAIAHEWEPILPDTLFIAPDAPTPYGDFGGFQWFDLSSRNPEAMKSELLMSAQLLKVYIEEILKHFSLTLDRVALVGFSQGAAILGAFSFKILMQN
jgi:phospholipase/carboxylesterase